MATVYTNYTNLPIDFDEQLDLLNGTGLQIIDKNLALSHLHSISYFRLKCYMRYFESSHAGSLSGIRWEDVISLHNFDNELKFLIYRTIQDLEVALRNQIITKKLS